MSTFEAPIQEHDAQHMALALHEARSAAAAGEVPVGAVVVYQGQVIGKGRNAPISRHDPSAHAEILALREAAQALGNYRLDDCELYVTLEPCAMCVGAMLHARLKRVVFATPDPKTGAAGSVVNLLSQRQLNHQTQCTAGVLAQPARELIQAFFQARRQQQRADHQPLREDALRTPDERFEGLPGYPWPAHYVNDLPSLAGLRMHYLDEGPRDAPLTYLCLHGNPAWSFVFRKMIPIFLQSGARVVAPDLMGFGKSDKPRKDSFHRFEWHRHVLLELVERLDLKRVVLVVQDWGGLLGLTLPMEAPDRYQGLLAMNTLLATGDVPLSDGFLAWREMCARRPDFNVPRLFARGNPQMSPAECLAYEAPYPNEGYRAALRMFPALVPEFPESPGAQLSRQAREFWQHAWTGRSLLAVGMQDPVLGFPVMQGLQQIIRNAPPILQVEEGGHFVQEHGEVIAQAAINYFEP
jgi:tRNA(adenine34) deaminase